MSIEPGNDRPFHSDHFTQLSDERDYGILAQRAAEAHLDACQEAEFLLDEGADFADVNDPSSAPFCGCNTCEVREVLHAAWPIMQEYFAREFRAGRLS